MVSMWGGGVWKRMEGGGSEAARVNGIGLVCRSTHNEGGLQVAFIHEPLLTVGL